MPPAVALLLRPGRRAWAAVALLFALLVLGLPPALVAANLPAGFAESLVADGLVAPTAMQFAPDGRLFVCEQGGALRVIRDGRLLPEPFLRVPVDSRGERGLLGVAFDPEFATNGYVYVYYTALSPTVHNRVSRFTASGDTALPGSEVPILDLEPLSSSTNHNGGALHFGPDGMLYIAVGDNANGANAQSLQSRFGKILRVRPDGSIPPDNPFAGNPNVPGPSQSIWALGLRNPFTFAFEPGTGRMFINDVGQNRWEEIDRGAAGANYGWPETEGPTSDRRFRGPIFAYRHDSGTPTGCAITGGAFYNPQRPQFPPSFQGRYFFADYCGGWIYTYDETEDRAEPFARDISQPVDLKVGPDGALYYLARGAGAVYRIEYAVQAPPSITRHPESRTVAAGETVTLSVAASGTPPLSYQWQRNGANIPGATAPTYSFAATLADDGARFRVLVTNAFGTATSDEGVIAVRPNRPPQVEIALPRPGARYAAGETVRFAGRAVDPEAGALPPAAFRWRVDFHHADHLHPFLPETAGIAEGSFVVPDSGETAADVFYRIHLTVTDPAGLSQSAYRDVLPKTARLVVRSDPPGLQLTLDGQPQTAPFSVTGVVGMRRTLGAPSPQTLNGATYEWVGWSDGGAATHSIVSPARSRVYTARFRRTDLPGRLRVTPRQVSFAARVGESVARRLTLENRGPGALTVSVGTVELPFRLLSGAGSFTLAAGERREVEIGFSPAEPGRSAASLAIGSSDPRRPETIVRLRGRATAP